MTTVLFNAVFKPFFKIVHDTDQQLTIDGTNFLTDGFLQIIQRTGFFERKHAISNTPKEKNHTLKDRESEGGHDTSPKREIRCAGNMFRTMVIDSFAVCAVAPSCWNYTLTWFILLRRSPPPPLPTYWVLPIQKMPGSRGSIPIIVSMMHVHTNIKFVWNIFHCK